MVDNSGMPSLAELLEFGNLTVKQTRALKGRSHSGFYEDLKKGLVSIRKIGRKSVVPGRIASRYIAGLPIEEVA